MKQSDNSMLNEFIDFGLFSMMVATSPSIERLSGVFKVLFGMYFLQIVNLNIACYLQAIFKLANSLAVCKL